MLGDLTPYLPILIPLVIIQLGLMVWALIHILTHKHYRVGTRIMWVIIAVVVNTIGPILYFVLGRSDQEDDD
ncbi:MAG: PLD nuclease N-terminal domain-containing protein [Propionibacteriaceae bacterium]|jgi:hypothetical protein|nr:PLD nuclease N-terminal domain-containing protein [Propionibacteriaceae bacterium]